MKDKEPKQEWLIPEVGKDIEYRQRHEIGRIVSEGNIYPVPTIVMDEESRKELVTWPLEISSRRVVILKPFRNFVNLDPMVLFDFETMNDIAKIEFRMIDKATVELNVHLKNGKIRKELLVLEENGKIKLGRFEH